MKKFMLPVCVFLACACLPPGMGCASHQVPSATPSAPAKSAASASDSSDVQRVLNAEDPRQMGVYVSDLQATTLFLGGKYVGSDCQPEGTLRLQDDQAFYRYRCKPPTKPATQEVPALQFPDTDEATFYTPYRDVWLVLYRGTPTFFWRMEDGSSIGQALTPTAGGYSFTNLAAQHRLADRGPKNPSVPIL